MMICEYTSVADLMDIYCRWVREYYEAKRSRRFGHASECVETANLISERLIIRYGVSEQHITQLNNKAFNSLLQETSS